MSKNVDDFSICGWYTNSIGESEKSLAGEILQGFLPARIR